MARTKSARRLTDKEIKTRFAMVVGSILAGVGIWQGNKAYQKWKAAKELEQHEKFILDSGVNLYQVAIEINDAFFNYMYGTQEDEQAAMDSLLTVPKEHVKTVALLYNKNNGRNLYNDFREYLSNDDYNKVKHLLQ